MSIEWLDVLNRIGNGEDARTEFKRNADTSLIGKALCAFANSDGGLLVLGVDDSRGVVGIREDAEKVQERLTSFLQNGCDSPITAEIGRHETEDGWVHWIDVPRQRRGFQPFNHDGRYWIRRGRSSVKPSPSELQELFNIFGLVLTEQQIISSAATNDIDLGAFRTFMQKQGKQIEEEPLIEIENDLINASVCNSNNNQICPTLYGLMVFGRDPQNHPNTASFFIDCVAYAGIDRAADVLSSGEGKGRLEDQVKRSVGWFKSLGWKEYYQGLVRRDIPPIPDNVLREVLVNAVIHRDYAQIGTKVMLEVFSDRIDITSPGTLPNHMTVEQACSGGAPRSRNEMMANAMIVFGLMERRGRGWLLMRNSMREFNNTEPTLVNDQNGSSVRVTFQLQSSAPE